MGKKRSYPWYREERNSWYVTIDGRQVFLGEHPRSEKPPKKGKRGWSPPQVIEDAYRRLLEGGTPEPVGGDTVIAVLDDFITWCKENRAGVTAGRYEEFVQDFVKASDGGVQFGAVPVAKLSAKHVTAWLSQKEGWGPTTKRNAITALIRGFNWACKNRGLDRNPIKGMEKPEGKTRTEVVSPAEFDEILGHALPQFQDLLLISYDSGARPFEVKELEKRHVDLERRRAVIPKEEAKGRKKPRVFYFPTDRSLEVVKRLCETYPEGPIFRNRLGNKWTGDAVKCTFARLEKKVGKRFCHYMLRHSFITRKLVAGVDSHVVASLAGHRDTKMLDQVYSHVADDYEFMLKEAQKDVEPKQQPRRREQPPDAS